MAKAVRFRMEMESGDIEALSLPLFNLFWRCTSADCETSIS